LQFDVEAIQYSRFIHSNTQLDGYWVGWMTILFKEYLGTF